MKSDRPDMTNFDRDMMQMFSGREIQPDTEALWAKIKPQIPYRILGMPLYQIGRTLFALSIITITLWGTWHFFFQNTPTSNLYSNNSTITINSDNATPPHVTIKNTITIDASGNEVLNSTNNSKHQQHHEGQSTSLIFNDSTANTTNEQPTKIEASNNFTNNDTPTTSNSSLLSDYDEGAIPWNEVTQTTNTINTNDEINSIKGGLLSRLDKMPLLSIYGSSDGQRNLIQNWMPKYRWKKKKAKSDCYDFSHRRWRKEIDLYIGPDWTKKFLEAQDTRYTPAVLARFNTESSLEAFSLGVQFNLRHRSGFYASIGLNYSQIDEKFSLQELKNDTLLREGIIRIDIDSTGKESQQTGQKKIIRITNWDKVTYNYYRYLSIPITLGYGFNVRGWGIEPSVGVDINVLFSKKGDLLNPTGQGIDIITSNHPNQADVFKSNVGLSALGAIKVVYPYGPKMDFFGEPYIRYQLSSITTDAYPLNQRYRTIGLRLGVRLKF